MGPWLNAWASRSKAPSGPTERIDLLGSSWRCDWPHLGFQEAWGGAPAAFSVWPAPSRARPGPDLSTGLLGGIANSNWAAVLHRLNADSVASEAVGLAASFYTLPTRSWCRAGGGACLWGPARFCAPPPPPPPPDWEPTRASFSDQRGPGAITPGPAFRLIHFGLIWSVKV